MGSLTTKVLDTITPGHSKVGQRRAGLSVLTARRSMALSADRLEMHESRACEALL